MSLSAKEIKTSRDIRLLRLSSNSCLCVSCDSAGGIGPKRLDRIKTSGFVVGKFTARVALMEALATGSEPFCVVTTLSVEPKPTGAEIMGGIRSELRRASISSPVLLQSSEKNFSVNQTGVGVTILASASMDSLRIKQCRPRDAVVTVGLPSLGERVLSAEKRREIADTKDVRCLLGLPFVHEILPVGSRGILNEAKLMARDSQMRLSLKSELRIDVSRSAGPATVVLCALPIQQVQLLQKRINKPLNQIGTLHRN